MINLVSKSRTFSAFALAICLLLVVNPSDTSAQGARARFRDTVLIIYPEQSIADSTRARVSMLIAQMMPFDRWRRELLPEGISKDSALNALFRYYPRQYPNTSAALRRLIDSANGAGVWRSILVPPIPLRGYARFNFETSWRVYDPLLNSYARFSLDSSTYLKTYTFAIDRIDSAAIAPTPMATEFGGTHTIVRIPVFGSVTGRHLLRVPEGVYARTAGGLARVQLGPNAAQACDIKDATTLLAASPYANELKSAVKLLLKSASDTARVSAAARATPLRILDWNVDAASGGHGSKVVSVAHAVLEELGLPFLTPYVQRFELNPARRRNEVKQILADYTAQLSLQERKQSAAEVAQAPAWIESYNPPTHSLEFDIREVVLRALLWKATQPGVAWYNMSFRIPNASFTLQPPELVRSRESFAVIAAGNEPFAIDPYDALQNVASWQDNLVNVTSFDVQENPVGSTSNGRDNLWVTLIAPGCGFSAGTIVPSDQGTSFASPYVAAAAWAAHLLTGVTSRDMRERLVLASRPKHDLWDKVESAGVFDPALLLSLSKIGTHFLTPSGDVKRIASGKITLTVVDPADSSIESTTKTLLIGARPPRQTLTITACDEGACAWVRPHARQPLNRKMVVKALSAQLILSDGSSVTANDALKFAALVRTLWY